VAAPIDPTDTSVRNRANRGFDGLFREELAGLPSNARLLEVGCGDSAWLPYFARRFGLHVSGLDYSEAGCESARQILERAGVTGDIVCSDLFDPPARLLGSFHAVVSFGVAEHFTDTARCISALARYLTPGGVLITVVPNMTGLVGRIEKAINPEVYDLHERLGPRALSTAHEAAGLAVRRSEFFLSTNFGVLNVNDLPAGAPTRVKAALCASLSRVSKVVWAVEERSRPLPATRAFAPYVVCVGVL
jgi:SAM-dependent methyltransferase